MKLNKRGLGAIIFLVCIEDVSNFVYSKGLTSKNFSKE